MEDKIMAKDLSKNGGSAIGDLTPLGIKIEKLIMKELNLKERPTLVLSFNTEADRKAIHWFINCDATAGLEIMQETGIQMMLQKTAK